jgi:hypothetical protein
MEPTSIQLGGDPVALVLPAYEERSDVALTLAEAHAAGAGLAALARHGWAALGLSLPPSLRCSASYGGDPAALSEYACGVYRELRGRGYPHNEIQIACTVALNAIVDDVLMPAAEAKERADFSNPQPAATI